MRDKNYDPFRKKSLDLLRLRECKIAATTGFDQEEPQITNAKGYEVRWTRILVAKLRGITEKNLFSSRSEICAGYKYTLVKASNGQLEKRPAFCNIVGSVCNDMTSMLHWLICRKCHFECVYKKGEDPEMLYVLKRHWLVTRGGTITNVSAYNFSSV